MRRNHLQPIAAGVRPFYLGCSRPDPKSLEGSSRLDDSVLHVHMTVNHIIYNVLV